MAVFSLWTIIVFVIMIVRISKVVKKQEGSPKTTTTSVKTVNRPGTGTQPKSFAAMPKQASVAPNVERNCSADDKHHYENNLSRFNKKPATAIPNVPSAKIRPQSKQSPNRKVARQLYIGDVVPQGMRVVTCGYCAADNLVPYGGRNEYKCYFCHYDI